MPTKTTKTPKKTIQDLKAERSASPELDEKASAALSEQRAYASSRMEGLSTEHLLGVITKANITASRGFDAIAQQIREAVAYRDSLLVQIDEAEGRLQKTHDLDAAQTSIDELIAEYDAKRKELEEEQATAEKDWAAAKTERDAKWLAEEAQRNTDRQRENDQFVYDLKMARTKEADQYERTKLERDRAEADAAAQREKIFEARSNELKAREKEFQDLKTQVAAFPEQQRKEIASATAAALGAQKKDLEHSFALKEAQLKADVAQAITARDVLQNTVKTQAAEIDNYKAQVEKLREQNQTMALKAFEATGGKQVIEELRTANLQLSQATNSAKK